MQTFNNIQEIEAYLTIKALKLSTTTSTDEVFKLILPVFVSPVTDTPTAMQVVARWFDLNTPYSLLTIIRTDVEKLLSFDLNLYKFKILCGQRGPLSLELFNAHILEVKDFLDRPKSSEIIKILGKHKDFPRDSKEILYAKYQDDAYLPEEAKSLFIF